MFDIFAPDCKICSRHPCILVTASSNLRCHKKKKRKPCHHYLYPPTNNKITLLLCHKSRFVLKIESTLNWFSPIWSKGECPNILCVNFRCSWLYDISRLNFLDAKSEQRTWSFKFFPFLWKVRITLLECKAVCFCIHSIFKNLFILSKQNCNIMEGAYILVREQG